jgi:hypothetical protein
VTGIVLCFVEVAGVSDTRSDPMLRDANRSEISAWLPLAQLMMRRLGRRFLLRPTRTLDQGSRAAFFGIARRGAVAPAMLTSCISG